MDLFEENVMFSWSLFGHDVENAWSPYLVSHIISKSDGRYPL